MDVRKLAQETGKLATEGQMSPVRKGEPYLVEFKRGPHFGVEYISTKTKAEAYHTALSCYGEDPDWVRVIDLEGNVVFTSEVLERGRAKFDKPLGITTMTFGVQVDLDTRPDHFGFVTTITQTS